MRADRTDTKRADEAYERVARRSAGRLDDLSAVRVEIEQSIPAADVARLQDAYFWQLTRGADERALHRGRSQQIGLFSGQADALDGYVALGDTARVKRRFMVNADWVAHLQLMQDNVQDVNRRYLTEQSDHAKLLPYLAQGMTTEEALAAYRRAQPKPSSGARQARQARGMLVALSCQQCQRSQVASSTT